MAMRKRVFENSIIKDRVMLVELSNETGGAYTLIEVELQPGSGNHFHYHTRLAKKFTAIKGELVLVMGRQQLRLQAGESVMVPADRLHRFYNPSDKPITFQIKLTPGHERFEHGLAITYGLAEDGKLNKKGIPKNLDQMALLMSFTDTGVPGFFSLIDSVLKWRAGMAMKRGLHLELIKRYCR
jgi:quercetin dioxygenase-like cupin family protein